MIVEAIVASVAAVTIAGTWLGLRFAERMIEHETPALPALPVDEKERREALVDLERHMGNGSTRDVKAILACRSSALSSDVRERAKRWVRE